MPNSLKDQTNKDTYNRIAKIYNDKHGNAETLQMSMDRFIEMLPNKGSMLDLGCGPGQYSKYASEKGLEVTGIDFSESMLKIAREKAPEVEFIQANILEYPFEDKQYDGVWASAVLLHFNTEEVISLLERINKSLVPNGILYVSFMEGEGERKFERIDRDLEDIRYFYDRKKEELEEMLMKAGFEIVLFNEAGNNFVNFLSFFVRKR